MLCAFGLSSGNAAGAPAVTDLKCEYARQPLGIDAPRPRLNWVLHSDRLGDVQTAYQILVASSLEKLANDEGDLWDSGKVESNQSVHVLYGGRALESRRACYWKVRAWDKAAAASDWSEPATWEMGLLKQDDWQAQWLNDGKANPQKDEDFYRDDPAPLFRKEFALSKDIRRARLYISGLGYYEASLNGRRVGDRALDPGWTRYSRRVLYSTYDVTRQLVQGRNCIGATLGNGWYNPLPLRMWGYLNLRDHLGVGRPRFIARLDVEFTDGTRQAIVSDTSWKVSEGPIRFNNIYLGEIYDARKELAGWDRPGFADAGWRQAAVAAEPVGHLVSQSQPPIRATGALKAVKMTEPQPGVFIFDLGRNFSGWANLKVSAPAGTRVSLRYGELLHKDGMLNPMTSVCGQIKGKGKTPESKDENADSPGPPAIAWQGDTYIARGNGMESYTPRFTFHAFRYVEVTGYPGKPPMDAVTGLCLSADMQRVGSFSCSNDRFNRIQEMCDRTFLSNLFSVQSDCPHRERFAYGGDLAVTSEAFLMNYDMATFYAKTVRDFADGARDDGMLTDTAPFVGIQYCGVAWAMAHPLLQRQLYQYCGNRQLIEEQFDASKRWLDLVASKNPGFIINDGLSDHEGLAPAAAPVMVTPLYAASASAVGELAAILGRADEAAKYQQLAANIRRAYLEKFFDKTSGKIGPGTQACQAYALYQNLIAPEQRAVAIQALLDDIRGPCQGHLSTGIFGTKFLLDALSREGHADTAYTIVNQETFPGWGYMLDGGATTLWEHWKGSDNTYSHNHPMFGSVSQWFYHWLGGIQPDPEAVGFDRIIIRPQVVKDLNWVRSSYNSVRGKIASNWRRDGNRLLLDVEIPIGATASVYVPADKARQIKVNGAPASQAPDVTFLRTDRETTVYQIGSGHYAFEVTEGQ
jgi:alpha-L-rhamnosidase